VGYGGGEEGSADATRVAPASAMLAPTPDRNDRLLNMAIVSGGPGKSSQKSDQFARTSGDRGKFTDRHNGLTEQ
jgi:hypothetical protein